MISARNCLARLRARGLLPSRREARELAVYAVLLPFALLPSAAGEAWAGLLGRYLTREGGEYRRSIVARMPRDWSEAAEDSEPTATRLAEKRLLIAKLQLLRAIIVPGWSPRPRLRGLENVRDALATGRGVILWVQPCLGSNVTVKRALHDAGYPLVHLSRAGHPFANTRFANRFVNPILRRPETRYLRERIVISDGATVGPLRRFRERLNENLPVSITFLANAARVTEISFFDGVCRVPSGPVELAVASGAHLLPVFTVGSTWRPMVIVGPRLEVAGRSQSDVRDCEERAVRWLESQVRAYPGEWTGWRFGLYRRAG